MTSITNLLKNISIIGMTYCGYHNYTYVKKLLNTDSIKFIKNDILIFKSDSIINEDTFCKIISSLLGTMIGTFYPIGIPYTLYFIDKKYELKKYIK